MITSMSQRGLSQLKELPSKEEESEINRSLAKIVAHSDPTYFYRLGGGSSATSSNA